MKMKKILKMIGLVILIVLVVVMADLVRKTIIVSKIEKNVQQYDSTSNYYEKRKSNEGVELEIMRKENIFMAKQYKENRTTIIYKDISDNTGWLITTDIDENRETVKVATKYNPADNIIIPNDSGSLIGTNELWLCIYYAASISITTEKVNGEECYKITNGSSQTYFSKDTLLRKKVIMGNQETEIVEYTLDTVTDEDIKLPDLSEYEIREQ